MRKTLFSCAYFKSKFSRSEQVAFSSSQIIAFINIHSASTLCIILFQAHSYKSISGAAMNVFSAKKTFSSPNFFSVVATSFLFPLLKNNAYKPLFRSGPAELSEPSLFTFPSGIHLPLRKMASVPAAPSYSPACGS